MSQYAVPQDVEAEDKLIGPLSFRQFAYLMIAVGAAALAFFLFNVSPFLIIIPLPIMILFGVLALPLRKDQPLELYLLAVIRFYLKPKTRKWDPDGTPSYVEITAPKLEDQILSKGYGATSAQERLDYLARILDSRGWAYKGVAAPVSPSVNQVVAAEASNAVDILDDQAALSRSLQDMISRKDEERRQAAIDLVHGAGQASSPQTGKMSLPPVTYNPYPASMHQKMVLPANQQVPKVAQKPKATATAEPASADIIRLANSNMSVSAIAHEARRLAAQKEGEEVVIKLR